MKAVAGSCYLQEFLDLFLEAFSFHILAPVTDAQWDLGERKVYPTKILLSVSKQES